MKTNFIFIWPPFVFICLFFSNSSICHFKSYTHSFDKLFFVFPLLFRFYFVVRLSSLWYDRRAQINQRRKRYWLGRSFFIFFLLQNDNDDDNSNKSNIRFSNNNTEQFNISTCIFNFFLWWKRRIFSSKLINNLAVMWSKHENRFPVGIFLLDL